jgi:hypothetical protein
MLARQYTEEAIATLAAIAFNPDENSTARVTAIRELLDRGWGKAPADVRIELSGTVTTEALTPIQREQEIARLLESRRKAETIDIEPAEPVKELKGVIK